MWNDKWRMSCHTRPFSRAHRQLRALSQEVGTMMMGRNSKILRKWEDVLKKEGRTTLSRHHRPCGFRGRLASIMQVSGSNPKQPSCESLCLAIFLLSKLKASQLLPAYLDSIFLDRPLWSIIAISVPLSDLFSPPQTQTLLIWPHKLWGPHFSANVTAPAVRKLYPSPCSSGAWRSKGKMVVRALTLRSIVCIMIWVSMTCGRGFRKRPQGRSRG